MLDIYINSSEGHVDLFGEHVENVERIKLVESELVSSLTYSPLIRRSPEKSEELAIKLLDESHGPEFKQYLSKPEEVYCLSCQEDYDTTQFLTCRFCNSPDQVWYLDNDTYITNKTRRFLVENIHILMESIDRLKEKIVKYSYILIRPPGHHCFNKGTGFCPTNNVYMMATYAKQQGFRKIFVFDYDAHAGNGSSSLVEDDPQIFLISMHAYSDTYTIYPGTGSRKDNRSNIINIPLIHRIPQDKEKYTDDICTKLFTSIVLKEINNFNPDLIIISNGLDAHKDDPLAGLNLTVEYYNNVCRALKALEIPLAYVLEGGYNPTVIKDVSLSLIDILLE